MPEERRSKVMTLHLDGAAPRRLAPPVGYATFPLEADIDGLEGAEAAARPPDHVDYREVHATIADGSFRRLLAGELLGPVITSASAGLRLVSGKVVGGIVVVRWTAPAFWAGDPWIADIFIARDLQGRGLGSLLLDHAIAACAADGEATIGLSVTVGNPAEHLYRRRGFAEPR